MENNCRKERLNYFDSNLPIYMAIRDSDGKYLAITEQTAQLFHSLSAHQVLKNKVTIQDLGFRCQRSKKTCIDEDQEVLEGQEINILEFGYYLSENKYRCFYINKKRITDQKGQSLIFVHLIPTDSIDIFHLSKYFDLTEISNKIRNEQDVRIRIIERYEKLGLSAQQSRIVWLLINGMPIKHISEILNISKRTVESYLLEIKYKLNVSGIYEVIQKSIELGLANNIPISLLKN